MGAFIGVVAFIGIIGGIWLLARTGTRHSAGRKTSKRNLRYAGYGRHGIPAAHADPSFRTPTEMMMEARQPQRSSVPVPDHDEIQEIAARLKRGG